MARPNWEYIRVDVLLPEHPKTDGLSDKAFRTLVEMWCWCGLNRTDGFVRDAKWKTFGTKTARDQIAEHGFAERTDGGWLMHDFTGPHGHQRSSAEIDELSERRAKAGRKGAATRWGALASAMTGAMASAMANACGWRKVKRWFAFWQRESQIWPPVSENRMHRCARGASRIRPVENP